MISLIRKNCKRITAYRRNQTMTVQGMNTSSMLNSNLPRPPSGGNHKLTFHEKSKEFNVK